MKPLLTQEEIREKVIALGNQITEEFEGQPLTILGVLTGSLVFLADLIRTIEIPLRVGLIQASSYRGQTTTAGELTINAELLPDITSRSVLLVDDIFDTGQTIAGLRKLLRLYQPAKVKTAVLLWKPDRTEVDFAPDYHCFKIPDEFVVGYGLDYNDDYRHLPDIQILEPEDIG